MLVDVEPFSIGTVNASFDKMFSSDVAQTDVEVIFHPRKNEVALKFKSDGLQYWQYWNEEGRKLFIEALNQYKADFESQKLITNYNKSRAIYGETNGHYEWKTLSISGIYRSSPVIELGYRFKAGSPYFSTHQLKAIEETGLNKKGIPESQPFAMYFNRAQGDDLARLFDQSFLLGLLGDKAQQGVAETGKDIYLEK
jgi:RNA recognition motif-containing protein